MNILYFFWSYFKVRWFNPAHSKTKLERWQNTRKKKILNFVKKNSPYFCDLLKKHDITSWQKIPLQDKEKLMKHFDLINTADLVADDCVSLVIKSEQNRTFKSNIGDITFLLSSGTSGHRGLLAASKREQARWAGSILAKTLPHSIFSLKKQSICLFLRANSEIYESVQFGRVGFHYFDPILSLESHLARLENANCTILVAPPSILRHLARLIQSQKMNFAPSVVFSVAEALTTLDQREIEKCFKTQLRQIYQTTEGFLACSCQYGHIHLNEELVFFEKEYLDAEKTRFVPIITDFYRTTLPIIRYRLNDVLMEDFTECPCGLKSSRIKTIEGRCDDVFYLKNKFNKFVPVWSDQISRALLYIEAELSDYSVIQKTEDLLEVSFTSVVESNSVEQSIKREFELFFKKVEINPPQINFVPYREPDRLHKLRRVRREFNSVNFPS